VTDATLQVQQYLKFSNNRQDKDAAKEYLSQLQAQQNAK
jgi:hypothetical protein